MPPIVISLKTVNNTPALNRYQISAFKHLVGRHSRRESGSVRVCLQYYLYELI